MGPTVHCLPNGGLSKVQSKNTNTIAYSLRWEYSLWEGNYYCLYIKELHLLISRMIKSTPGGLIV